MKRYRVLVYALLAVILASCQQVFTYSPLSSFQRDPADVMANMSTDQKAEYAQNLLDQEADAADLAVAYEEISSAAGTDPELNLLAANLAVGASGLNEAMTSVLETVGGGGTPEFEDILASLDMGMLANVQTHFSVAVDSGSEIAPNEYVNASAALILTLATDTNSDGVPDDFSGTFTSIDSGEWDTVLAATPESLPFPGAAAGSVEEALNWAVLGGMAQFMNDYFAS